MRQRDFPKSFLVEKTGAMWDVKWVRAKKMDELREKHGYPLQPKLGGLTSASEQIIYLVQGLKPVERLEFFVHEFIHVIEAEYDIDIPHEIIYLLDRPVAEVMMTMMGLTFPARSKSKNDQRVQRALESVDRT